MDVLSTILSNETPLLIMVVSISVVLSTTKCDLYLMANVDDPVMLNDNVVF